MDECKTRRSDPSETLHIRSTGVSLADLLRTLASERSFDAVRKKHSGITDEDIFDAITWREEHHRNWLDINNLVDKRVRSWAKTLGISAGVVFATATALLIAVPRGAAAFVLRAMEQDVSEIHKHGKEATDIAASVKADANQIRRTLASLEDKLGTAEELRALIDKAEAVLTSEKAVAAIAVLEASTGAAALVEFATEMRSQPKILQSGHANVNLNNQHVGKRFVAAGIPDEAVVLATSYCRDPFFPAFVQPNNDHSGFDVWVHDISGNPQRDSVEVAWAIIGNRAEKASP